MLFSPMKDVLVASRWYIVVSVLLTAQLSPDDTASTGPPLELPWCSRLWGINRLRARRFVRTHRRPCLISSALAGRPPSSFTFCFLCWSSISFSLNSASESPNSPLGESKPNSSIAALGAWSASDCGLSSCSDSSHLSPYTFFHLPRLPSFLNL